MACMFRRLAKKSPSDPALAERISHASAARRDRASIPRYTQQHRYGKNDRTDKKRDAAMAERCQKQDRRADHRTHESDPVADTIRQFLAS